MSHFERESLTSEWEQAIQEGESLVQEDPEAGHLFATLVRRYYDPRLLLERSSAEKLNEVEIDVALDEHPHARHFTDLKQQVLSFHKMFKELDQLSGALSVEFSKKDLSFLIDSFGRLDLFLGRLTRLWDASFRVFLRRFYYEIRPDQASIEKKFGARIDDLSVFQFSLSVSKRLELFKEYPDLRVMYERFRIDSYYQIVSRLGKIHTSLREQREDHPEAVIELLQKHAQSTSSMNEWALDELLGIAPERIEKSLVKAGIDKRHAEEQVIYQGTPYDLIRDFLKELALTEDDVLYDLGCGYGRIPLYGAITTPATFKGIELIPERVAEANGIKQAFQLEKVEFRQGNVLEEDYSDGSVFFLFNPFSRETLEQVIKKLEKIAKTKKIRIISLNASTKYFARESWLREVPCEIRHPWGLTMFES